MKLKLLILAFFCALPLAGQDIPACLPIRDIPKEQVAFGDGETITLIPCYICGFTADAGELTMTVSERSSDLHGEYFQVDGYIKTNNFISRFFKVRDYYQAKFKTSNLRPFYYMRDIHEGNYSVKNFYKYRTDNNIDATIVHNNGSITDTLLKARECTFDIISLIYFARNIDTTGLKVGDIIPLSFAIDDEVYDISLRFEGRKEKRIPGQGTFKTLKFAAQVVAGVVFTGKEELLFWVTDDNNRLPVSVESPIIVGRIAARLGTYSNLKHPLTSKIK